VELDRPEQLAEPRRRLAPHPALHRRAADDHRLRQCHVVPVQQVLGGAVRKLQDPALVLQVGEQALLDLCRGQAQRRPDLGQYRLAVERRSGLLPVRHGGPERGVAQLLGRVVGRDLELAAVFEQVGEPLVDQRPRPLADHVFELGPHLPAGVAGRPAEREQQLLRHPEPAAVGRVEVERDELVPGVPDADELSSQQACPRY
jgi:hypothetical protein